MFGYVRPTIGELIASAQTLCRQGYKELNEGQLRLASETFWRAAKRGLKAEARRRGWDHETYSHLFHVTHRLSQETGDQHWLDWFERVTELRRDSIAQQMGSDDIRENARVVDRMLITISRMKQTDEARSPGAWINIELPEDLRKDAYERLLAGDLAAASESYWDAVHLACKDLAERIGWDPESFPNHWKFFSDLEREFKHEDDVRSGLAQAQFMHNGAVEGWFSESAIREHDAVVRNLIKRLEDLP